MLSIAVRVLAATAAFGAVHSLLASRQAKALAARTLGVRQRNGWYRVFYNAQAIVTLVLLGRYLWRLPDRELYHVRGRLAGLMRLGQVAGLAYAVHSAAQVGLARITGLGSWLAWLGGSEPVPPEPEAQGPAPGASGRLRVTGAFRWSRHPLNFAPVPIMWLFPRLTVKGLIFNLASTLYLVLGSLHEEARLRAAYGPAYAAYQALPVPFYWPRPNPVASAPEGLTRERQIQARTNSVDRE